jgi:hypothetical protein
MRKKSFSSRVMPFAAYAKARTKRRMSPSLALKMSRRNSRGTGEAWSSPVEMLRQGYTFSSPFSNNHDHLQTTEGAGGEIGTICEVLTR